MYYAISDNTIHRIEGSIRNTVFTYQFDGLVGPLFYEPSQSAIYIFDSFGLRKINNGASFSFGSVTPKSENYFVYNTKH
jgi:hypothetical protein